MQRPAATNVTAKNDKSWLGRKEVAAIEGALKPGAYVQRAYLHLREQGGALPVWARKQENETTLRIIQPEIEKLTDMNGSFSRHLNKLTAIQKQALVERHLISREHAARAAGSAAVINREQSLSIMIN